jgi:hypothetical protein
MYMLSPGFIKDTFLYISSNSYGLITHSTSIKYEA